NHHGARGHTSVKYLVVLTVIDARALADEHAHGDHGPAFDDDAFDDFRARADEAVVFDDGGAGLQGLQYPADADAARQMHVLADLRAGSDGGPGIDHGAAVHISTHVHVARH